MDVGKPKEPDSRKPVAPETGVWSADESAYGDRYQDHLLEQYKLLADTACQTSGERGKAGTFFLTLNTTLATVYTLASLYTTSWLWRVLVPLVGLILCLVWDALIVSYKNLNRAKFDVLHEMEKRLPAAMFKAEWDVLQSGGSKRHRPLTHVERAVPYVFVVLYLALLVVALFPKWAGFEVKPSAPAPVAQQSTPVAAPRK